MHVAHRRQPLRYAGYVWDAESNNYYCSARQYDPVTGQFLTKDPVKSDGEQSAYQYAGGDPVGRVDPSGEWRKDVHYRRTFAWVAPLMPYDAAWIALSDGDSDKGSPAGKGYQHGMKGAEAWQKIQFKRAVDLWPSNRCLADQWFGEALHTRQDIYAHRRAHWTQGTTHHWKALYRWSDYAAYEKGKHGSRAKHSPAHDNWKLAKRTCPSATKKTRKKTISLVRKFKAAVGA